MGLGEFVGGGCRVGSGAIEPHAGHGGGAHARAGELGEGGGEKGIVRAVG